MVHAESCLVGGDMVSGLEVEAEGSPTIICRNYVLMRVAKLPAGIKISLHERDKMLQLGFFI